MACGWALAASMAFSQPIEPHVTTPAEMKRSTEQTFLTFPEWFLVFSSADYATLVQKHPPDHFPFLGHIRQFWQSYAAVARAASDGYPVNGGYHLMIAVIGVSTTVEYAIKSAYETVFGRLARLTHEDAVDEDRFSSRFAQDYVDFIRVRPWYEYDFMRELARLWTETPMTGPGLVRRWERKYILTTEFIVKAAYGRLITGGTHAAYEPEVSETAIVTDRAPAIALDDRRLRDVRVLKAGERGSLAVAPRYQAFTDVVLALAEQGVVIKEICGNDSVILLSAWRSVDSPPLSVARLLFEQELVNSPGKVRQALVVSVAELSQVLTALASERAFVEHVYDY